MTKAAISRDGVVMYIKRIEELRNELKELLKSHNIRSEDVLKVSQKLDELLLEYHKKKPIIMMRHIHRM